MTLIFPSSRTGIEETEILPYLNVPCDTDIFECYSDVSIRKIGFYIVSRFLDIGYCGAAYCCCTFGFLTFYYFSTCVRNCLPRIMQP